MNYWRLEKEDFSNLLTNGKNEDIKTIRMIGVKGIEKETFNNFTKLEEVIIEDDALDKIGEGAFENCESLRSISSTRSVTELGNRAFYRCENLRYLDLSSCQTLGDRALAYTGLTSVRFVALKTIETKDADEFAGCSNLEHVYIYNTPLIPKEQIRLPSRMQATSPSIRCLPICRLIKKVYGQNTM